jgi:microsomal epoxide hydrolase
MSLPINATLRVSPFKVAIAETCLEELRAILKLTKLPPPTYEGIHSNMGVTRQWIADTKERWENEFDWSVAACHGACS